MKTLMEQSIELCVWVLREEMSSTSLLHLSQQVRVGWGLREGYRKMRQKTSDSIMMRGDAYGGRR